MSRIVTPLGTTPFRVDSGMVAEHPVVNHLSMGFNTRTSTVTRRDYDVQRPNRLLERTHSVVSGPALEDYRYPLPLPTEAPHP